VHIIAHSKGAEFFYRLGMTSLPADCTGKIGQVILGHGDVLVWSFKQVYNPSIDEASVTALKSIADSITIYK